MLTAVLRYCAESTNRTGTTDVKPHNVISLPWLFSLVHLQKMLCGCIL
jgi:hypothetical protein